MGKDQSASKAKKPVSDGQAAAFARMLTHYPGGGEMFQLAMSDPKIRAKIWNLIDCSADEQALRLPIIQRPPFMMIQLGVGPRSGKDFIKAITDAGGGVSKLAAEILDSGIIAMIDQPTKLDLVAVSGIELGFSSGVTLRNIYAKIQAFGLELGPLEMILQLGLQYSNQLCSGWAEYVFVGTGPITVSGVGQRVFAITACNDAGCYLGTEDFYNVFDPINRWMFCRRKK